MICDGAEGLGERRRGEEELLECRLSCSDLEGSVGLSSWRMKRMVGGSCGEVDEVVVAAKNE